MRSKIIVLSVVLAFVVGLAGWWFYYARSPEYAFRQIEDSVRNSNRLKFEQYIDIAAMSDQLVDAAIGNTLLNAMQENDSGFGALGASLGAGIVERLKAPYSALLRSRILEAVEDGTFEKILTPDPDSEVDLSLLSNSTSFDPSGFEGLTELQQEGDVALFGIRFRNSLLDTTLIMNFRMEWNGNKWQITGFDSIDRYMQNVSLLQRIKLLVVNMEIESRLEGMVKIGKPKRDVSTYSYTTYVTVKTPVTNLTDDTLTDIRLYFEGIPETQEIDNASYLPRPSTLLPGKTRNMTFIIEYNQFIGWHKYSRYGDLYPRVLLVSTEGETIRPYASWNSYVYAMEAKKWTLP